MAQAQRPARAGPSKVARKPSPCVSISLPRNRAIPCAASVMGLKQVPLSAKPRESHDAGRKTGHHAIEIAVWRPQSNDEGACDAAPYWDHKIGWARGSRCWSDWACRARVRPSNAGFVLFSWRGHSGTARSWSSRSIQRPLRSVGPRRPPCYPEHIRVVSPHQAAGRLPSLRALHSDDYWAACLHLRFGLERRLFPAVCNRRE